MAEENEIKIPQGVFDRANEALRRGEQVLNTGSIFTQRERNALGVPQFPFGGRRETTLDVVGNPPTRTNPARDVFGTPFNDPNVQYEQDRASRIANRYTFPTADIARTNISFGNPLGGRMAATSYLNPERSASIEASNAMLTGNFSMPESPDVGRQGITGTGYSSGGGQIDQIMSPAGFASTTLTPEQVRQRDETRARAEQQGLIPRTPEQQAAAIAQIRENAAKLNQERTQWVMDTIADRKINTPKYTTPSGATITAPTNQFGQPIQSWADIYGTASPVNQQRLADVRANAATSRTVSRPSQGRGATTSTLPEVGTPLAAMSGPSSRFSFSLPTSGTNSIAAGFIPSPFNNPF